MHRVHGLAPFIYTSRMKSQAANDKTFNALVYVYVLSLVYSTTGEDHEP
jgi:hypothetical protein